MIVAIKDLARLPNPTRKAECVPYVIHEKTKLETVAREKDARIASIVRYHSPSYASYVLGQVLHCANHVSRQGVEGSMDARASDAQMHQHNKLFTNTVAS